MFSSQLTFFYSLGWAVISSFWQMALLWLIYKALIATLAIKSPSLRTSLASSLMLTGFTWFVITILFADDRAIVFSGTLFFRSTGYVISNTTFYQLLSYSSYLYLIALIFPVLRFIKNYRYARTIRRYGTSKPYVEWKLLVQRWAPLMGIRKKVQVLVSEFVQSPLTVGFFKPVILLPLSAISHLSPHQVEALLLHELSHISRNDYLMNFIIRLTGTLFYFNPFVKAFAKEIEKEREKSCDMVVLQYQYNPHEYASALLKLQQVKEPVFYLAATGNSENLLDRINLIIGSPESRKKKINFYTFFSIFLAVLLFCISLKNNYETVQPIVTSEGIAPQPFTALASTPLSAEKKLTDNGLQVMAANKATTTGKKAAKEKQVNINSDAGMADNGFRYVANKTVVLPELKKYQEEQVNLAVEVSKRIAEEKQWKLFEKNLAEVFTNKEKQLLHGLFSKKMEKYNWDPLENSLRMAYEKVDWEKLNYQLNTEVGKLRLDSLKTAFSESLVNLNQAESFLKEINATSVPDTDITLQVIDERKTQISKLLDSLQEVRSRRIIRL